MDDTANTGSFYPLMARAMAKLQARDFRGGAALLESAARISNAAEVWQLLGITWNQCGEKLKARDAFLKVVERKPGDPRVWANLGAMELDLGLFDEGIAHYRRATEQAPERADLQIWLANAYDRAGNLADALETYRKAEALEPNNAEVFYERALALRNHKRFAEAATDFRRAYELDPSREDASEMARQMAVAPHQRPTATGESSQPNEAAQIAEWSRALVGDPGNAPYWNNRGWARWQSGDLNAALSDFEHAIQLQPDYLQARVNHSMILKRMGRIQEAEEAQRKVVEVDPNFAHGHYNLAATLLALDKFEEGLRSIDRCIAIDKKDPDYFLMRGALLERLDRKPEALAEFTRAIAIDKTNWYAYYLRGNMQFDLGRLQTAVADYTGALGIHPGVAEVYLNRGLCYFGLDRAAEARADLEKALELKPGFGIAHLRLGELAQRENRPADAEKHFAIARSLGLT